jgi:hypothetical protein
VAVLVAGVLAGSWLWSSKSRAGTTGFGAYGSLAGQRDVYATEPAAVSSVGVWAERVARNVAGYTFIFAIPDSSLRMKAKSPWTPLGLVSAGIMGLAALGWGYQWRRRAGLPEWYALVCGGVLLTYVWYDIRYVVPLWPLVFFYWLWSVEFSLGRLLAPSRAAVATAVVAGLFFVANAGLSLVGPQARRLRAAHYHGPAAEIHQAALWIRQQDPKAVIMSRWANMVWFWTRQPAVGVPLLADSGAMWQHMQARQVGFVIVDPDEFSGVTGKYLEPLVQQAGSALELVQQFGRTRVYRVNR